LNWQNLPGDLVVVRRAITPKHPEWVLHDFDFSKIEPRLLAYFASKRGDDSLAGYIRDGRDPYKAVVSRVYGKTEAELTDAEYKRGKILFLSLMYGGGIKTIREQFGVEHKEAKRLINQFHDAWPIVRHLQDDLVRVAERRGYVRTPWGRHLHMEEFGSHKMLNKLVQGSAAHALKRALIRVDRWLVENPQLQSHMILTIHDSIDFDGPADEAEILHENVPGLMVDEPLIQAVVPLLVEHEISPHNWAEHLPYDEWKESLAQV
jgi:DNA polymerase-1